MVQTALGIMGQTYQPNMFVGTSNLESAMGKLRATFAEYGLGASTGIDLPDESTGFIPKSIILLITLPMHLASLITILQCNWPSMLEPLPTMVFGLHLTLLRDLWK